MAPGWDLTSLCRSSYQVTLHHHCHMTQVQCAVDHGHNLQLIPLFPLGHCRAPKHHGNTKWSTQACWNDRRVNGPHMQVGMIAGQAAGADQHLGPGDLHRITKVHRVPSLAAQPLCSCSQQHPPICWKACCLYTCTP